jgi:DNA-directed RNA polymerase specialized sigma24 family protein
MADRAMIEDLPLHVAALRRYALASTGSRLGAEDLVQETLTHAIAAAPSFRRGANLRGWLFTIMHNAFISSMRARRAADRALDDDRPSSARRRRSSTGSRSATCWPRSPGYRRRSARHWS